MASSRPQARPTVNSLIEDLKAIPHAEVLDVLAPLSRHALSLIWEQAGIDDEAEDLGPKDPNNWPCWCRARRCEHGLSERLRGMLGRLSDRQAERFVRSLRRRNFKTAGIRRAKRRLEEFALSRKSARNLEEAATLSGKELVARLSKWPVPTGEAAAEAPSHRDVIAELLARPDAEAAKFLWGLRLESILVLQGAFPRPGVIAKRDWYVGDREDFAEDLVDQALEDDEGADMAKWVQAFILRRLYPAQYAEARIPAEPTIVCPGKPKVAIMAARRGEGQPHDSGAARANPFLGRRCHHRGDLRLSQLPGYARRGEESLKSGYVVVGQVGLEEDLKRDIDRKQAPDDLSTRLRLIDEKILSVDRKLEKERAAA